MDSGSPIEGILIRQFKGHRICLSLCARVFKAGPSHSKGSRVCAVLELSPLTIDLPNVYCHGAGADENQRQQGNCYSSGSPLGFLTYHS
jgi:hypothetical protein